MREMRWTRNENKLKNACKEHWADFDKIMKKEKYWRYDLSDRWSGIPHDVMYKIEDESLDMCQTCGKTSRQFRDYGWRYTHHCLKHFLLLKIKILWKRIKWNNV